MKAKKLDSDEVSAVFCCTDRGQCNAGHWGLKCQPFTLPSFELHRTGNTSPLKEHVFNSGLLVLQNSRVVVLIDVNKQL